MDSKIFTAGVKSLRDHNYITNLENFMNKFLLGYNITIVIDTRSVNSYKTYSETNNYHPLNLYSKFEAVGIKYYNLGDILKIHREIQGNLSDPIEISKNRTRWVTDILEYSQTFINRGYNVCVLFDTVYTLGNGHNMWTNRGIFCRKTFEINAAQKYYHYVDYSEGTNVYDNYDLFKRAYGELRTIRVDFKRRISNESSSYFTNENYDTGYSNSDLDDMYRDAYGNDPNNEWNTWVFRSDGASDFGQTVPLKRSYNYIKKLRLFLSQYSFS